MRYTKFIALGLLLIGLMAAAFPSFAAQAATIDDLIVNTDSCTLTVIFTVEDAGDYYVQIWDDGELEYAVGGATAAGATVSYTMGIGPVAQGIPGIGVYIMNNATDFDIVYASVDPFDPDFGDCSGDSWTPADGGATVGVDCPNPLPAGFVVRSIPAGALAYFEASEGAYTGFNLPEGQTWYTGAVDGGFVEVWIACEADNVFVPAGNVVG